jgi:steroid 5-alpha reductase family enzyme
MNPWLAVVVVWAGAMCLMTLGWLWQMVHENAGIVDVIWTFGIGASAAWYAAVLNGAATPRALLVVLAGVWSLRLARHLMKRVIGAPEDGRYRQLRLHWRGSQWKLFLMFQFQALLIVLFSLPFLAVAYNPRAELTSWMMAAIAVWTVSVAGEAMADRQLARFRADENNRGRTCRVGLWRYSRHPN